MARLPGFEREVRYVCYTMEGDICSDVSYHAGDIVYLSTLGQSMVVLGSSEIIFEYLDQRSANTSDRTISQTMKLLVLVASVS